MKRLAALIFASLAFLAPPSSAQEADSAFKNWAAFFVAGDYRASTGADSDVFDNGRRDLASALARAGFSEKYMKHFSVRPMKDPVNQPSDLSSPRRFADELVTLGQKAKDGCLFFITTHGSPDGLVVGEGVMPPQALRQMLDQACGTRPTVVLISACYSGVFVPALEAPNRMIMTAARADRPSFGCGESDRYTYFDNCLLEELPGARSFDALPPRVRACVSRREQALSRAEGVRVQPSEPQVSIGPQIRALLPLMAFNSGPARTAARVDEAAGTR